MLSINFSELIWTIINFFLLYFLLKRFLFGPLGTLMDERQAKIDAGIHEEKQAEGVVQSNRDRLSAETAERRLEASGIISTAEAEDEERRAAALKDAHSRADEELRRTAERLEQQNELDEAQLQQSRGELSAILTAHILGQEE